MKAINIFLEHFQGNKSAAGGVLGHSQQIVSHWAKTSDMPLGLVPKAAKLIGKNRVSCVLISIGLTNYPSPTHRCALITSSASRQHDI